MPQRPIVLVVDDEPDVLSLVETVLESELDCQVLCAEDGTRALDMLDSQTPALVITDVRMPLMDGVELVRRLRARPTTRLVPILVFATSSSARDQAIAAGATGSLDKPFDISDMVRIVGEHLDSNRS